MAGNGEGGARYSSEQWHGAAVQRLSPSGGCSGPWRSGATEVRRRAQQKAQRGRDGGGGRQWRWRSKTGDASFVDGGAIVAESKALRS
ncbi:hypothetical protein DEO72_LG10g1414 [Vigna unguiculata]|uniref:Uncharacterized protein n=1 Tax=Vigna unguiculata TaxID=3917 RepID=A0A4D6NA87_VIGUN|nr:hypothetical protein DEO72_LG10g1414 [Vigna unguiculata]